MLLTGDTIDGATAADWGLVLQAVPAQELDGAVEKLADRMTGVPINQLVMQKLLVGTIGAARCQRNGSRCPLRGPHRRQAGA